MQTTKRPCPAPKPVSPDAFDVQVHPLYPNVDASMPLLVDIRCNVQSQSKEYPVTLVVLADVSGSMMHGHKLHHMREGIVRLGELAARFCAIKTNLVLIEFHDEAEIIHASDGVPSRDELHALCLHLSPGGGTNIGSALELAMQVVPEGATTHIALFTDGEDSCDLLRTLAADDPPPYLAALRRMDRMWLHCVGICAGFDCRLLYELATGVARRGTFQCIQDDGIARAMGALWGLMVEAVDPNCAVQVAVDGAVVHPRAEALLRVCDPPADHCVLVPRIPAGAAEAEVTLFVGDESKAFRFALPIPGAPAIHERCAIQAATSFQSDACRRVLRLLADREYDQADALNRQAAADLEAMFPDAPEELAQRVAELAAQLQEQARDIASGRSSHAAGVEAEMRTMSRSATLVNQGASIDPWSRTLSDLQSQLSADY